MWKAGMQHHFHKNLANQFVLSLVLENAQKITDYGTLSEDSVFAFRL